MYFFSSVYFSTGVVYTTLKVKELDSKLDTNTYRNIFSKAKESTTLSPYVIHYGKYIAATNHDLLKYMNSIFMRVPI